MSRDGDVSAGSVARLAALPAVSGRQRTSVWQVAPWPLLVACLALTTCRWFHIPLRPAPVKRRRPAQFLDALACWPGLVEQAAALLPAGTGATVSDPIPTCPACDPDCPSSLVTWTTIPGESGTRTLAVALVLGPSVRRPEVSSCCHPALWFPCPAPPIPRLVPCLSGTWLCLCDYHCPYPSGFHSKSLYLSLQ